MRIPSALWGLVKETARHLLRRPVVGVAAVARTPDGAFVLVRRGDTGQWALPGGTLEWGETLRTALRRELREETGTELLREGALLGVYSEPSRDLRFHAVTVVVEAQVGPPRQAPTNALEILEVRAFLPAELPKELSHGMTEMLERARRGELHWE